MGFQEEVCGVPLEYNHPFPQRDVHVGIAYKLLILVDQSGALLSTPELPSRWAVQWPKLNEEKGKARQTDICHFSSPGPT